MFVKVEQCIIFLQLQQMFSEYSNRLLHRVNYRLPKLQSITVPFRNLKKKPMEADKTPENSVKIHK